MKKKNFSFRSSLANRCEHVRIPRGRPVTNLSMKLPLEKEAADMFEDLLASDDFHRMRVNPKVCRDVGGKVLHARL